MRRGFWIAVSAAMFAVSYTATSSGMIGGWDVHVLGVRHGSIWDPGGSYLGSGLLLFEQPFAPYVGHPGLTLTLLCHIIAKVMYLALGGAMTFDHFAARNIHWITFASMIGMTGAWLASFALVERLAQRVLEDSRLAMLAVVAYATTFPVLYYLNKISPEPLLVFFTLLAFLWLWRYYELGNRPLALVFLALSAQASVAALYTKFMIVGPIVLFIPLQLLLAGETPIRRRIRDAVLYVGFCVPALMLGALKTDWPYFFQFWFAYAPGGPQYSTSSNWLSNVLVNAPSTALAMLGAAVSKLAPWRLMPSFDTREGLFFASGGLFMVLSLAGLVMYLRATRNRPTLLLWFLAFVALTAIPYLQRGLNAWHYLFVHFAVASVFFSYAVARLATRLAAANPATRRGWAVCLCTVLAVNSVGLYLFVDMRRFDAQQYRSWGWYYKAPAMVGPDGRIGLVHTAHVGEILQPLSAYLPLSGFLEGYRAYLVPISGEEAPAELRRRHIEATVELTADGLVFRRVEP